MSGRHKYSLNGVHKRENFLRELARNDFFLLSLGTANGINPWYLTFQLETRNNQTFVFPAISCNYWPKLRARTFFNILKKDGSSCHKAERIDNFETHKGSYGHRMNIEEVLNPENGYLDNGSLSVEYGIEVDAIQNYDSLWIFDFYEPKFHDSVEVKEIIMFDNRKYSYKYYWSREILNFNYPQLVGKTGELVLRGCIGLCCLQILHGVRLQISSLHQLYSIIGAARSHSLTNVILYCDQPRILNSLWRNRSQTKEMIKFNLRHCLAEKLRDLEFEFVVDIVKQMDLGNTSGEVMKAFVAKIFRTGADEIAALRTNTYYDKY